MNMLDHLGIQTRGLVETVKPFESWEGTPINDWEFTIQLLGVGDLADIAKWTSGASAFETDILKKIYVIAKALISINGQPVVSEEDVETYNTEHRLIGTQKITIFALKVLYLRKLNEAILNRLVYVYDSLEEKYLENHLGDALYKALKGLTNVDVLNAAAVVNNAEQSSAEQPSSENPDDISAAPTTS